MFKPCSTIFIKTDLFTESDHSTYAEILGVPADSFVKKYIGVLDVYEDEDDESLKLLSFHYRADIVEGLDSRKEELGLSDSDVTAIKSVRGIIIDTQTKEIVCKSFPYTTSIVLPEINVTPEDKEYYENSTFHPWKHGALIRVFQYKGKSFASSHRKISCDKSKFGRSRFFDRILLEDQDVFPTLDSFFDGKKNDFLIHLFIINNEDLVIESTHSVISNQVYHIKSFDLKAPGKFKDETRKMSKRIVLANKTATKPILFPDTIPIEEANKILRGNATGSINKSVSKDNAVINAESDSFDREMNLNMLRGGDSVLMENEYGVFRVVPPSNRNSSIIMGGNPNPAKVFVDAVALFTSHDSSQKIPMVQIGFSRENLTDIASKLKNSEEINFDDYEDEDVSSQELILTNVLFATPKHLIDECLTGYDDFNTKFLEAYNFLWLHKDELKTRILSKTTNDFTGFSGLGKKLQAYIKLTYVACFNEKPKGVFKCTKDITGTGIQSNWCSAAISEFDKNMVIISECKRKKYNNAKVKETLVSAYHKNAIIAFISNADVNCLYGLLNMPAKIDKTIAAFEKSRALKAAAELEEKTA